MYNILQVEEMEGIGPSVVVMVPQGSVLGLGVIGRDSVQDWGHPMVRSKVDS